MRDVVFRQASYDSVWHQAGHFFEMVLQQINRTVKPRLLSFSK